MAKRTVAKRRRPDPDGAAGIGLAAVSKASEAEAKTDPFLVGWAITRAQRELQFVLDAELGQFGTTISQLCVLHEIKTNPALSNAELARLTFQSAQSLGQQVLKMQERGLLRRRPGHGRKIQHYITKAGDLVYQEGMSKARAIHAEIFADLDERDRKSLVATHCEIATRAAELRRAQRDQLSSVARRVFG